MTRATWQGHFQHQRSASASPDSPISTSRILHGVVRYFQQAARFPWLRILPKELDEKVPKLGFFTHSSGMVHKLMDAMCSFLRGRCLTPQKIRAERSANVSALKLRGAGLTPHFQAERSLHTSVRARISSLSFLPSLTLLQRSTLRHTWAEYLHGYASTAGTSTRARCADAQRR